MVPSRGVASARGGRRRADLPCTPGRHDPNTLEKSEKDYSPSTLYRDYPLSSHRFHWETQGACHPGTRTGQRYMTLRPDTDDGALLFVRQRIKDERGATMPYTLLGRVFYSTHRGERPMAIEWELETPMPASLYLETKVAAG